ncbi:MAG: hypothetical protein EXX96DRAFT_526308 [Benjaminiella poitrasii]|nr:MAG: hypothetical protein EXX96DRAFT_526308 [Benjaminiella poitrasii]
MTSTTTTTDATTTSSQFSKSPSRSTSSIFQWPIPPNNNSDISIRDIIEKYYSTDRELLKHALTAKMEEDKKQTAKDILKAEQARLQLRYLDIELMKEQSKLVAQQQPTAAASTYYHHYYYHHHQHLTPVQQVVDYQRPTITTTATDNNNYRHYHQPHSAHPLCLPDNNTRRHYHLLPSPSQQPTTPISPNESSIVTKKRTRASISTAFFDGHQKTLSHTRVMEALKAKIQRTTTTSNTSSHSSHSPLVASAFRPHIDKRQRTLPKPADVTNYPYPTPSSPNSLRSTKPTLPPIDTTIGRIPPTPTTANNNTLSPIHTHSTTTPPDSTTTTTTTTTTLITKADN